MKQIKPYLIFLAVLVGILAGIALTAEFDLTPQLSAENNNAELREMRDSATIEQKDRDIARSVSDTLAWVAQRSIPAVVSLTVERKQRGGMILDLFRGFRVPEQTIRGTGSGFFVSAKGFIITNYHVVAGAEKITVNLADDRVLEAEVRGEAPNLDLAVVKVEGEGYPFLEFGDSDEMRIGETVLAIGSPFGYRHTVTAGIVSAQAYVDMKNTQLEDFIQTDAAVNPGNSGGPLLNLEGKVVGVNTAISSKSGGYDGISFAIPSNFVSFAYSSLRKEGKIEGGFVGVGIDDVDPQTARENDLKAVYGCLITDVLKDGPADRAGVKAGDIVLEVNGKKVRDHIAFYNLIYFHRPGEMITLKILRDGKEIELTVSVSTRAAQAEKGWEMGGPEAVDNAYGAELREENRNGRSYVVIESVEEGSVASRLSLREGDVVIQINGQEINSTQAFKKAMDEAVKADRFKIRILRNGMTFMLEVEGLNVEENGEPDMF